MMTETNATKTETLQDFPSPSEDWVEVGEIMGSVGVTTDVKVRSTDAEPDWLRTAKRLWIRPAQGKPSKKNSPQWVTLTKTEAYEPFKLTLQIEGWNTPELIKSWIGATLHIEKAQLPKITDAFTFRTYELVGLDVWTTTSTEALADVTAIISATHAGDQNFIELTMKVSKKVTLIPFEAHFVEAVDISAKRLTLKGLDSFLAEENTVAESTAKKLTPYAKRKLKRQAEKLAKASSNESETVNNQEDSTNEDF
ncbi:MAG: ribosome maturation factor RimM [Vampirovibrionales bacterium]|jgi:16S rRNA processing protein RimM